MKPSCGQGAIPEGWRLVRLGDVAEVQSGVGFPLNRQGRLAGDYPFIKVSDMTLEGNETYIRKANNYVDDQDVTDLKANIFQPGTVVFPKVGAAIATNKKRALTVPTLIDNNMVGITVANDKLCDARFLHSWFESIDIAQFANVSAVPSITSTRLKQEFILLPPLPEQRAIAAVLDSIDEAIEGAEAVIAATEQLRDSLLHQLLTCGVPGWHTEWKDVPGLGTIPADWEVVRLGEVAEVQTGRAVNRKSSRGGSLEVPYLSVANVKDGYLDLGAVKTMQISGNEVERYRLKAGDVLFTEGGDADKLGRGTVWKDEIPLCLHQNHIFAVRPHDGVLLAEYLAFFAASGFGKKYFLGAAKQTTNLASVNSSQLREMPLPLPSIREQNMVVGLLSAAGNSQRRASDEQDTLKLLRESTADAMLTGRVRV